MSLLHVAVAVAFLSVQTSRPCCPCSSAAMSAAARPAPLELVVEDKKEEPSTVPPEGKSTGVKRSGKELKSEEMDKTKVRKLRREASVGGDCLLLQKAGSAETRTMTLDEISSLISGPAASAAAIPTVKVWFQRVQRSSQQALRLLRDKKNGQAAALAQLMQAPVQDQATGCTWHAIGMEQQTLPKSLSDLLKVHPVLSFVHEPLQKQLLEAYDDRNGEPYSPEAIKELITRTEDILMDLVTKLTTDKTLHHLSGTDELPAEWQSVLLAWQLHLALTRGKHRKNILQHVRVNQKHKDFLLPTGAAMTETIKCQFSLKRVQIICDGLLQEVDKIHIDPAAVSKKKADKKKTRSPRASSKTRSASEL